jgi:hypothetical protein
MTLAGFEPTISAGERPQTYALDCSATGIGKCYGVSEGKGKVHPVTCREGMGEGVEV